MDKGQHFVVKYDQSTDLYLLSYSPDYNQCTWTSADNPDVMTWNTLSAAQTMASLIGHGTVGTVRP